MQRRISVQVLLLALCLAGGPAWAQGAVLHPNQIAGTIELTNSNPAILAILATEGFVYGVVQSSSIGTVPPLFASTEFSLPAPATSAPYQLTVEAGPAGGGIAYNVAVDMRLDSFQDRYLFAPAVSSPVEEEPAPDVALGFSECAGILDVRWETSGGDPVSVNGGEIHAFREISPGSNSFELQAQAFSLPNPTQRTRLAVRGDGSLYQVDIYFDVGTDPFADRIRFLHRTAVTVGCDQIVEIVCVFDEGDPGRLGRIVGQVDMLGEAENFGSALTFMTADSGPFGNFRYDTVLATPSSGAFELENLVPSDAASPPSEYRVLGAMSLRTGRRAEYFLTPWRDGPNGRVPVAAGQTTDLGTTFVMDPGFVAGDIRLAGPPVGPLGSCLQDLYRDADADGDANGLPDDLGLSSGSVVFAHGLGVAAPGATLTSHGGFARVGFEGAFNAGPADFTGDYELALASLLGEPSLWRSRFFDLRLSDQATPEVPLSYQRSLYQITDNLIPDRLMVPGQTHLQPLHYCFNQVNLTVRTTAGTFFGPQTSGSGSFAGTDFEGNPADYSVSFFGAGTPLATPASQGLIVLCVPQGSHTLFPQVLAVNPGGGVSATQFLPVAFSAGCRQRIDLDLSLQPDLDPLPACSATSTAMLSGSFNSTNPVTRIAATVNGGSEVVACTNCGVDPEFSFQVPLQACDNEIKVSAEDDAGATAAVTTATRFDVEPPALAGCRDILAESEPGGAGAVVTFDVTAADTCDGGPPVVCDPPSGSFFPEGETAVICSAADRCGNRASCGFTVSFCRPVAPDVRTQGFWKRQCEGPHPSGEHARLAQYVGEATATATFAAVAGVPALCDRLHPQPANGKCEQAEAQLMALLLNLASGRVVDCNCLQDPDLGAATVGAAVTLIDGLLSNPARQHADCVRAQAIADRINNSATLVSCPAP